MPEAARKVLAYVDRETGKVLRKARLLLEAGSVGRTKFYRCSPYIAYIGTGFAHRDAVKDWNPPETQVRAPCDRRRSKKDEG